MMSIFSCTYWPSVCLLWRNVYLGLLPILWLGCLGFLLLNCKSCLYILEIKPFSVTSLANIFSQSIGCLFVLFMASHAVQILHLIRSQLFIFIFISIALGDRPSKTLVQFMSENVLPLFSSRSFMRSCFIFKPLHLALILKPHFIVTTFATNNGNMLFSTYLLPLFYFSVGSKPKCERSGPFYDLTSLF